MWRLAFENAPTCNQRLCRLRLFAIYRTVRLTLLANELAIVAADLHCIVADSRYVQIILLQNRTNSDTIAIWLAKLPLFSLSSFSSPRRAMSPCGTG